MEKNIMPGLLNEEITKLLIREFEPTRKESYDQIAAMVLAKVAESCGLEVGMVTVSVTNSGDVARTEFTKPLGPGKYRLYVAEVPFNSAKDKCPCCGKVGCYWSCK